MMTVNCVHENLQLCCVLSSHMEELQLLKKDTKKAVDRIKVICSIFQMAENILQIF